MSFDNELKEKVLVYDGSKGFLLMQQGLAPGEIPDMWNLTFPDVVFDIHKAYIDAGADVLQTNTLQASRYHLEARGLYEKQADINRAGVGLAKKAAGQNAFVAASVGPLGTLMAPFGETSFAEAYSAFSEQIGMLFEAGAQILHFETFTDLSELRIAVLAARDICRDAPLIATISLEPNGRTVMGDDAMCAAASLAMLGVCCFGANCGLPPIGMLDKFEPFTAFNGPLCSKPNAGTPIVTDGIIKYGATEDEFYDTTFGFARLGARLIGGCCGSGPSHINSIRKAADIINIDDAYNYSSIIKGVSGQDDTVMLCSHNRVAYLAKSALLECSVGTLPRTPGKTASDNNMPVFCESNDGSLLTVDLSGLLRCDSVDSDKIIEILSDSNESDAEATIFSLLTSGCRAHDGNVSGCDASAFFGCIASNSRVYHNKPIVFHTDDTAAMNAALTQYCGAPAILVAKAEAGSFCESISRFTTTVIQY